MASIARRTKSKYWTACYTDKDGRQLKRSTKTTDKSAAMQIALEYERAEQLARQGVLTTTQLRKVFNDVSEKVNGDSINVQSVEDYFKDWLAGIGARNSPATLLRYKNATRWFLSGLQGKAKKPITSITPQDIEDHLNARLKAKMAPTTAVVDLKIIKSAFHRAEKYDIILKNPVAAVRLPKANHVEREVFSLMEIEKLLNAAPSMEWQTLILLGSFLGARLRDCVRMKWENVFPTEGFIVYQQQKTGRKVTVPMHPHIIDHVKLLGLAAESEGRLAAGYLCPKLAARDSGGKYGLSQVFKRIVVKAGLDLMTVEGNGIRKFSRRTFHSLRHSFNSFMANNGVSDELRMKVTGHKSKTMNERYTHLQLEALKGAINAVPLFAIK